MVHTTLIQERHVIPFSTRDGFLFTESSFFSGFSTLYGNSDRSGAAQYGFYALPFSVVVLLGLFFD